MTVMWSTRNPAATVVQWRLAGSAAWEATTGTSTAFSDVGNTQTIHQVGLVNLTAAASYEYQVGDGAAAVSGVFNL